MTTMELVGPLAELREREIRTLTELGDVLARLSADGEADRQRLRDVADDLRELFLMVVVVGEFNAGKSSLVNALLEDELLPMGITPTTEAIELIRYGKEVNRRSTTRSDGVREWVHPGVGGQGVVLVDTPGTGSVFQQHEITARSFLHRSDIVIFVLSAKRAFAETDRMYMEVIRDYGKKVIVVVNQCDLLASAEQNEVRRFVKDQVEQQLDLKPLIFMVSAKNALAGEKDSNLDAVRAHLNATFEQLSPAKQKLLAQLDYADTLLGRYHENLAARLDLIGRNREKTTQIQQELEIQADSMTDQLTVSSAEVTRILSAVRRRGVAFIDKHFRVSFGGRDEEKLNQEFADDVIGRSLEQINDIANDYVNAQVDSNRRYWQGIVKRLNQLDDLLQEEINIQGVDGTVYSEQRQALQDAIAIADAEQGAYSNDEMLSVMRGRFQTNLTGLGASAGVGALGALAALGGAALPGKIAASAAAVFGVAVGVPIAIGGGAFAFYYWRRLRSNSHEDFANQINLLEQGCQQAMVELTNRERTRLLQYGKQILDPVFNHFAAMADTAERNLADLNLLKTRIAALREQIGAVTEVEDA